MNLDIHSTVCSLGVHIDLDTWGVDVDSGLLVVGV
jgi:hypothetical protein